jgi:type VI secretion system secreted protein VgrG
MTDSNSYSFSTTSGTSTGVTNTTSTGSSSSSTGITTIVQTSSPDDSQGMSAVLGGEALAGGTNTLTAGNLSGTLIGGGSVTSAELSASMVAASQSSTGTAFAAADTFAGVSSGSEVLVGATIQSASSNQSPTGSVATATSTTNLVAYDIHPSTGGSTGAGTDATGESDPFAGADYAQASVNIDGNIALIEFNAVAVGDDTFVGVDAFALAVEDELSISGCLIELAVD